MPHDTNFATGFGNILDAVIQYQYLDDDVILRISDDVYKQRYVSRDDIIKYQTMNEQAIRNVANRCTTYQWGIICEYQRLSETFIDDHEFRVRWKNVCKYQILSIDFILQHHMDIVWHTICVFQEYNDAEIAAACAKYDVQDITWENLLRASGVPEPEIAMCRNRASCTGEGNIEGRLWTGRTIQFD